jgi:hypothetical protein
MMVIKSDLPGSSRAVAISFLKTITRMTNDMEVNSKESNEVENTLSLLSSLAANLKNEVSIPYVRITNKKAT